ncbi:MAG: methylmalonyl-CoA mutase family protein [Dehalococcoidia bacterium]|nr:methylmalonyl-CoA mutase family protein [Dehalococcoidia bacterium]
MAKETKPKPNRSLSGLEVKPVYTPEDLANTNFVRDLGQPGEFPFTRGPYPDMYLGRLWTRRQIAGFGTAQATNERYRFLLDHGQNGISTDFDHPTLTGYDSDHDLAEGEVGRLGVAIDSVRDMDDLFLDIPLDKVSVSLTINHPAIVLMGMFLSVSEKRGVDWKALRGTVQNDSLKEFHGQKTFALGPGPSLKLTTDIVEFCTKQVPNWYTISISGYHIRESGSDAIQELAFTIAQGMAYVESALERGLPVDSFAPRLSFFFGCHNDVFEEVAKFRAARRMWARIMKERYNAQKPESMRLRFHTQTLGSTLMRQDPQNNIARGTLQALAAVLGGTQSLHVSGFDEAFDIPSEEAMRMSLATQLILSHESGVTNTVDPMAGSYFMESMTNDIEEAAWEYISKIEALGEGQYQMKSGMLHAIDTGYIELEIARSAYEYQLKIERGEQVVVGLNQYQSESNQKLELFQFDPEEEEWQKGRLAEIRGGRSPADVKSALASLKQDVQDDKNLMPAVLAAVGAMATEGEILDTMRDIYGEYVDPGVF